MPRKRTISPEFFLDEDIGDLSPVERLLFAGLWCQADRDGRLKDKPRTIKATCLPYDDVDIDAALQTLADGGFIIRYSVDGQDLIQIRTWSKHQNPHHTEPTSKLPSLTPLDNGCATVAQRCDNGSTTVLTPLDNVVDTSQKQEPRTKNQEPVLPTKLAESPEFVEWFEKWQVHRSEIKKPLKPTQLVSQLQQFADWGPDRSVACIRHTIRNGWQGLREPEQDAMPRRNGQNGPGPMSPGEYQRERQRRLEQTRKLLHG